MQVYVGGCLFAGEEARRSTALKTGSLEDGVTYVGKLSSSPEGHIGAKEGAKEGDTLRTTLHQRKNNTVKQTLQGSNTHLAPKKQQRATERRHKHTATETERSSGLYKTRNGQTMGSVTKTAQE